MLLLHTWLKDLLAFFNNIYIGMLFQHEILAHGRQFTLISKGFFSSKPTVITNASLCFDKVRSESCAATPLKVLFPRQRRHGP